jgi:hypothetical protein
VSRGTRDEDPGSPLHFADGTFTLSGGPFQEPSAIKRIGNSPSLPPLAPVRSRNPGHPTPAGYKDTRFGLFPVRSPLLGESLLISLPGGTEMFHFPPLALQAYVFSLQ